MKNVFPGARLRLTLGLASLLGLGLLVGDMAPAAAAPQNHSQVRSWGHNGVRNGRGRVAKHYNRPQARSRYSREMDADRDGIPNSRDRDIDNDGILNGRDRDTDNDGYRDNRDRFPHNPLRH